LIFGQPKKIAHNPPSISGSLNHEGLAASSRLMGLEPRWEQCSHQAATPKAICVFGCGFST
jgi:hypothetical protein